MTAAPQTNVMKFRRHTPQGSPDANEVTRICGNLATSRRLKSRHIIRGAVASPGMGKQADWPMSLFGPTGNF
jgi:hypothetical protein